MRERIFENHLIFDIDADGNRLESFQACEKFIVNSLREYDVKGWSGFWDEAGMHFTFDGIEFKLEYSGFFGTELKCNADLSPAHVETARNLAKNLIQILSQAE